MKLSVNLTEKNYDIIIQRGALHHLKDFVNLSRKVFIITDSGVPIEYANIVKSQCENAFIHIVEQGEGSKSFDAYKTLSEKLLENKFARKDLIIALGGGVIGDLAGFVASTYLRGIDFIGVPTTTLSQIDSSIGGKVAINFMDVKNIIGSFYHPCAVIIDSDTLNTLPRRHFVNGLVEAVKAGFIYDESILPLFENDDVFKNVDEIIYKSLIVKKQVVEQDEKEQNLRKILNFGHTIGHGIETVCGLRNKDLYHGECVAIGMMPMFEDEKLKERACNIFDKLGVPTKADFDLDEVYEVMTRDKKAQGSDITIVKVAKAGEARLETVPMQEMKKYLKQWERLYEKYIW